MFKIGEYAVCPGHGVAQIIGIEDQQLGSENKSFYTLKVLSNGMTIMVPTDSEAGIRELSDADEIDKVFSVLADHDVEIDKSTWNRRYRDYMARIKSGSLIEIAAVLRALFLLKRNKKNLSFGEKKMYDQCKGLISTEISLSAGKDKQGVEEKIDSCFKS